MISKNRVITTFRQFGDAPQKVLIKKLLKQKDGEDILQSILKNESSIKVRRWAVEGLAQGKNRSSVNIAKEALSDPNMSVRLHAIVGFELSGMKNRIRWIENSLFDESGGIRVNAVVALGKHCPNILKKHSSKILKDEKKYVIQQMQKFGF